MRQILLAAALCLIASAAHASGAPKKDGADKPAANYVDITPVAAPIIADGRLVNYVFVQVRVNLASSADSTKLREKEPYLRDALVRAAHRTPFTASQDYFHVDEAKLKAAMMREAGSLIGAKNLRSVEVVSQQAKQRSGVPRRAPRPTEAFIQHRTVGRRRRITPVACDCAFWQALLGLGASTSVGARRFHRGRA